jgi:hypothetical protein
MALDYYLEIQNQKNKIEPELLLEALISAFSPKTAQASGIFIDTGCIVNAFKMDDPYDESIFKSSYSDVCVSFRIDKFERHETGIETMLRAVVWFMSYLSADMHLAFDSDEVILQRVSGKLVLNDSPEFWTESRLSLLQQPYRITRLIGESAKS